MLQIEAVNASTVAASGELVTTQFIVDIINVGGLADAPSVPVFMAIGEGSPEQVHEVDRPATSSQAVSFLTTRDLPLGLHTVTFMIGDSEHSTKVDVRAADVVLEPGSHAITGDGTMALSMIVENQGDLNAENVSVLARWKVTVLETGVSENMQANVVIDSLGAGRSQAVYLPIEIPTGSYTLDIEAETDSIEVRTDNNTAATTVQVDYVTLAPKILTSEVLEYHLDRTATADVTIEIVNTGVAPTGPVQVGAACEEEADEECLIEFPVDSISPGAATSLVAQLRLLQGRRPVTIYAGGIDDGYRWGEDNVQEAEVDIPELTLEEALALLPWVRDGVSSLSESNVPYGQASPEGGEHWVVDLLSETFRRGQRDLFWAFLGKPWFQDGLGRTELSLISDLAYDYGGGRTAVQFLNMPFLDSIEDTDLVLVDSLNTLRLEGLIPQLMSHPVLQEGVTDEQLGTVILLTLELLNPQAADTMRTWSWVQDGISADELNSMRAFWYSAIESEQVFWEISNRPWVRDSITQAERRAVWYLSDIGREYSTRWDLEAALAITQMPFLDAVEPTDVLALVALFEFPRRARKIDDALNRVLALPVLQNGIADEHAVRIASLRGASNMLNNLGSSKAMESISILLDPNRTSLNERTIVLPHSGEVTLLALHTSGGSGQALDGLEQILRSHDETIGAPLPFKHILMLLGPVPEFFRTSALWTGFVYIDRPASFDWHDPVAYAVSDFYWHGPSRWISDGAGELMKSLSENRRTGAPLKPPGLWDCADRGSIRQFEMDRNSTCLHRMGAGLFFDLYRNVDGDAFRRGFGDLYLTMDDDSYSFRTDNQCYGSEYAVCYVKHAFVTNAAPESAAIAEPIIDRWYYGEEGRDK